MTDSVLNKGILETDTVFVFGALRSGTTLFRLMLEAHEQISNPGEADFLFDYIAPDPSHPTGWRYDVEALRAERIFQGKALNISDGRDGLDLLADFTEQLAARSDGVLTLNVHRHIDRIASIYPKARIIHLLRDPRDVARSSIGMGWAGTLYYGVDHWIGTEGAWDRVAAGLDPTQVFELKYETLFQDVEGTLQQVCDFLGVPYNVQMLDYHKTSTYGPPDASLVEQWRHQSSHRDIGLVEAKAKRLMRARGYVMSGPGIIPGAGEKAWLYLANKSRVWRFGVRRFGAIPFLSEKAGRWLGLTGLHRHASRRMSEIQVRHLK